MFENQAHIQKVLASLTYYRHLKVARGAILENMLSSLKLSGILPVFKFIIWGAMENRDQL